MTIQEAYSAVGELKGGLLLGQIGKPEKNDTRQWITHARFVTGSNFSNLPVLTCDEYGDGKLHIWIPVHIAEIKWAIDRFPVYPNGIGATVQQAILN